MDFNDYYVVTGGTNADFFNKLTISLYYKSFIIFYYHNLFFERTSAKVKNIYYFQRINLKKFYKFRDN